jgi:UDP-N-acetyl-D-glucosamine dehydrogenase
VAKKNRPYTRSQFGPSSFEGVQYKRVDYEKVDYPRVEYDSAQYISGATTQSTLLGKINIKDAVVSVIGLGPLGLPLAVRIAEAGYRVMGVDERREVVEQVNHEDSGVGDLPASTDYSSARAADCLLIVLPAESDLRESVDIYLTGVIKKLLPVEPGILITVVSADENVNLEPVVENMEFVAGEEVFLACSANNRPDHFEVFCGLTPACDMLAKALFSIGVDRLQ